MRISAELPIGVAAMLGSEAARLRRVESALAATLAAEGFEEALLPLLDFVDPYQPILGPRGQAELYRLVDRDGELLAVRSDFTPMLARLLAPRLDTLATPLSLFYRGEVVRRDADHPSRRRALWQLGAELLGVPGEAGEHRILELFLRLVAEAGAPSIRVVVGLAGALDGLLLDGRDAAAAARLAAAVERRDRSAVRGEPALLEIVEHGVPSDPMVLGAAVGGRLGRLGELCRSLERARPGNSVQIDLAEFAPQSLDPQLAAAGAARSYYDGLVFRAFIGRGFAPVGSGGRYDALFAKLGAATPAVGFTIGLDRLVEALDDPSPSAGPARIGVGVWGMGSGEIGAAAGVGASGNEAARGRVSR